MSRRTSPPSASDDIRSGQRIPEDENIELIRNLRAGLELDPYRQPPETTSDTTDHKPSATVIPSVIERVLASSDRNELIEVAKMLDQETARDRAIIFHTPVGDIRCRINWQSCEPENLRGSESIFFVKMRASDVAFTPKSGASFEIGFTGYAHRFSVMCLTPPQQLYPGVDLMCFLPHNPAMEKNGKLQEGAPSVVSGAPSDRVDSSGEPVVEGEKSAATIDFDRARDGLD